MLKIYGRANSINVRKVLWIADELGLAYTREDWGRGFRPLTEPPFSTMNPMGGVPVVDDEGTILRESNVIVRHLADKHQRADLYPTDRNQRSQVELWMDWASSDLYWGVKVIFQSHVMSPPPFDPVTIAAAQRDWTGRMQSLERYLATGPDHLAGPSFTIADIPTGLVVNRWFLLPIERPDLPAVTAYYERLSQRPAYLLHGRNGTP